MGGAGQASGVRRLFAEPSGPSDGDGRGDDQGVIDRLSARGFTLARADPADARRLLVELTGKGAELYERAVPIAQAITEKTLEKLAEEERATVMGYCGG